MDDDDPAPAAPTGTESATATHGASLPDGLLAPVRELLAGLSVTTASTDPLRALVAVCEAVVDRLGFASVSIDVIEPGGGWVRLAVAGAGAARPLQPWPSGSHGPGWDVVEDQLRAPLRGHDGTLIGQMVVAGLPDGRPPRASHLLMLDVVAIQAALILRAQLERRRLERELAFADLGRRITAQALRDTPVWRLLTDAADLLCEGFAADRVLIHIYDSERWPAGMYAASGDGGAAALDGPLPASFARVVRQAWEQGHAAVLDLGDAGDGSARPAGGPTLLVAPLGTAGELFGDITWRRAPGRAAWDDLEQRSGASLADDVADVVAGALLLHSERGSAASLRELERRRRELMTTISHEFKGPISAVVGHAELIGEALHAAGPDGTAVPPVDSLAAISRNAGRLAEMAEALFAVDRGLGPVAADAGGTDLLEVVAEAIDTWRFEARRRDITVHPPDAAASAWVRGSRTEVGHIMHNLLSNAVKYSLPGGEVRLFVEDDGAFVALHCVDRGLGIAPAEQERVFDRHYRGVAADVRAISGTGLGLDIVRRIVGELGGTVAVTSRPGRTEFVVRLPRAAEE